MTSADEESEKSLEKKTDRRSRRSQKLLFDALIELVREKDYDSITVTEITERADLARVTFYQHFSDKDALLTSSLDSLFERVSVEMGSFSRRDVVNGAPFPALVIFEVVAQDPKLFEVILKGQGGALILQRFRYYAAEGAYSALKAMGEETDVPTRILSDYVAGALLSVITGWLENGMKTPTEDMMYTFQRLFSPTLAEVLLLEEPRVAS